MTTEPMTPFDLGPLSIVAVDVGNSTVAIGRWVDNVIEGAVRVPTQDRDAIEKALDTVRGGCANQARQAIVIASVVPGVTAWLAEYIEEDLDLRPFVIGDNTELPARLSIEAPDAVGVDRVCTAAAAFAQTEHACVVVDIGTAVTIDLIDDEGVFCGGTILPGPLLQVAALAGGTAQLPAIKPEMPDTVLGQDTTGAIHAGVTFGLIGAIRGIVEQIATERRAWPQVILTGGGAALIKDRLDFVDNWVPDLCLMGVGLAYMKRVANTLDQLGSS